MRAAKRLADVMDAPWIAVTVEKPGDQLSDAARRHVDEAMKLAQSLGAETSTLAANDIAAELLRFSRFENVTQIVLGRSRGGFLTELLRRSLPHELVRRADGIAVHVITSRKNGAARWRSASAFAAAEARCRAAHLVDGRGRRGGRGRARADELTTFPNLSMVFLLAVVFAAVSFGIWPAIYASVLSFLAYNLFFIEPLYTFTVAKPHELLALAVFLVIAVVISTLAGRVREQAQMAVSRMRATRRLYEFTRRLSGIAAFDDIPEAAVAAIHSSLARPALVLLEQDGELELRAAWPPEEALDTAAMTAARWALEHNEPAGADTATLPSVPWFFLPLQDGARIVRRRRRSAATRTGQRSIRRRARCSKRSPSRRRRRSIAPRSRAKWCSARCGRDRARAQYAAGLDLARLPHAAGLDPRARRRA